MNNVYRGYLNGMKSSRVRGTVWQIGKQIKSHVGLWGQIRDCVMIAQILLISLAVNLWPFTKWHRQKIFNEVSHENCVCLDNVVWFNELCNERLVTENADDTWIMWVEHIKNVPGWVRKCHLIGYDCALVLFSICDLSLNHPFIRSDLNNNNFFLDKQYLETRWQ